MSNIDKHIHEGKIMLYRGKFEEAIKSFKKATILNPQNPETALNLAKAYNHSNQPEKTIDSLICAAEASENPKYRCILAEQYKRYNDFKSSVYESYEVLSKHPRNARSMVNIGEIFLMGGEIDLAIPQFAIAIQIGDDKKYVRKACDDIKLVCLKKKKYFMAFKYFIKKVRHYFPT